MFSLIPILVAFAVLGAYDILGNMRINLNIILFFSVLFALLFLYQINFSVSYYESITPGWTIAATIMSAALLLLLPNLGLGDKIFLVVAFFLYPFWLIWIIFLLAQVLMIPIFGIILFFKKNGKSSLPFYPFLFLAALIVYFGILAMT